MNIETIPPHDAYPGRTMLRISNTRSIICMGVGEEVEQAIREKAALVEKEGGE